MKKTVWLILLLPFAFLYGQHDNNGVSAEEALQKLIDCEELKDVDTEGLSEFRKCHAEERYPGLGSVKKMALKHHVELMKQYFVDMGD